MSPREPWSASAVRARVKELAAQAGGDESCAEKCAERFENCTDSCGPDDVKCVQRCGKAYRDCLRRCGASPAALAALDAFLAGLDELPE